MSHRHEPWRYGAGFSAGPPPPSSMVDEAEFVNLFQENNLTNSPNFRPPPPGPPPGGGAWGWDGSWVTIVLPLHPRQQCLV